MENIMKFEGSKSIIQRVLIISTFLKSPLKIINSSRCEDVQTLIYNLTKLGFNFQEENNSLMISPTQKIINSQELFIQNSGTALRLLISRLAIMKGIKTSVDCSVQLKKRPIKPLLEILQKVEADINYKKFPIEINGKILKGGKIEIPANISSQFISSILLVAPCFTADTELILKGKIVSRTYIKLTQKIMKDFGVESEFKRNRIFVPANQEYKNPEEYHIEPDFSSACYFWALGALSSSPIFTEGGSKEFSQPDFRFLKILSKMGAKIQRKPNYISVRKGNLIGIEIDMKEIPDQVPTLAVLSLFAESKTKIKNIHHLKYKESNRISGLINELQKIGCNIKYEKGVLLIHPLKMKPLKVKLHSYQDHRLVMAFYILKTKFPYLTISDEQVVKKSYPDFFEDIKGLKLIS
ncbi:MAG: 3-phosphoshikimate 1-carboxyvinyltransferase [Armatimonadetes bacterium]|nr:3-phosphoshikimate 1-carboxyvinyltransferase [Armatimonadota bacterium]